MSGYLMSEKTKNGVINLLAQKSLDITGGRRRSRGGGWSQPRSVAQQPVPAVVTSGTTLSGYTVNFYENGFEKASTGTGTCHVLDLAAGDNIPSGERIMAMPITITETGDGE